MLFLKKIEHNRECDRITQVGVEPVFWYCSYICIYYFFKYFIIIINLSTKNNGITEIRSMTCVCNICCESNRLL